MPSATKGFDSEKTKLIQGSDVGPLFRKSTVASSTTRISSGGAKEHGRPHLTDNSRGGIEFLKSTEQKPYMLSLSSQTHKKPPHKLKPLPSAKVTTPNLEDAETFQFTVSKSMLNELDKEMKDYLDVNAISTQLETAFTGK